MSTKTSDQLKVHETTIPRQSPQQKQLKMANLNAWSAMPVPMTAASMSQPGYRVSLQVTQVQMLEQSLLHLALQKTEAKMEGINHPQSSLSPLAWERRRSDTGLCPKKPHFHLNQILDAKMMKVLCLNHLDKFIYQTTYKIDMRRYDHFKDDLKVFSNNVEEILLQIVTTCMWLMNTMKKLNGCQTLTCPTCSGLNHHCMITGRCQQLTTSPLLSTGINVKKG